MDYLWQLLLAFAAGFGAGISVKLVFDRSRNKSITQKNNIAGRDIAGGDIHKP